MNISHLIRDVWFMLPLCLYNRSLLSSKYLTDKKCPQMYYIQVFYMKYLNSVADNTLEKELLITDSAFWALINLLAQ